MRVLHLLSSTDYHGAEAMSAELIRQLSLAGINVEVGIFDNAGHGNRQILDMVSDCIAASHLIPCRGRFDLTTIKALRNIIRRGQFDLIHSHKYKTTFYALLAKAGTTSKLVVTYHNWLNDTPALRAYALLDKHLARYGDALIGVSREVTATLRRHGNSGKIFHVPNGIDLGRFQPAPAKAAAKVALGIPANDFVIGFVGRLTTNKGVADLLAAFAGVHGDSPHPCRLLIIGDGEQRAELEHLTTAHGLTTQVQFLGHRTHTAPLYAAMDIFVLPSHVEAFPMVILEAMASKLPVIATTAGDIPLIIENNVNGYLVPVGDITALQAVISRICANPELAAQLGEQGSIRVEQYSSARMAAHYLDIYHQVLAG